MLSLIPSVMPAKFRRALRKPQTHILQRESLKLFKKNYMEYLEELGIAHRNTFYGKLKRRTLSDEIADKISKIFMVETKDWYAGYKVKEAKIKVVKTEAKVFRGKKKIRFLADEIGKVDISDLDDIV